MWVVLEASVCILGMDTRFLFVGCAVPDPPCIHTPHAHHMSRLHMSLLHRSPSLSSGHGGGGRGVFVCLYVLNGGGGLCAPLEGSRCCALPCVTDVVCTAVLLLFSMEKTLRDSA